MAKAFEKLVATYGTGLATEFNENAKALINGTSVSRQQIVPIKKKGYFQLIKKTGHQHDDQSFLSHKTH